MISFKKLLSIILSVSFLLTSTRQLSVLAFADYCYKNAKGGYAYVECANGELLKVSRGEVNYTDVKNLGKLGNQELVAFNFRGFDEMFEEKKIISTDSQVDEITSLSKKYNDLENLSKFWTKKNIFYMISGTLIGTVVGLFRSKSSRTPKSINHTAQDEMISAPVSHARGSVFSSLFCGLLVAILPIIGFKINNKIKMQNLDKQIRAKSDQFDKAYNENKCKPVFLNTLLYFLDRPEHIDFDMVAYELFTDDCNFHWRTSSSEINYTKEELEAFPQKFREMAAKIRKNLVENGGLLPHNYLKPQDNTSQEGICINCQRLGANGNEEL